MTATCKAELHLADDHGDNVCTIRCQLPEGHPAHHSETFDRSWGGRVAIQWERDERPEGHSQDCSAWPADHGSDAAKGLPLDNGSGYPCDARGGRKC